MNKVQVATHDGIFHADEVYALAVLSLYFEKEGKEIEVTRTRDLDLIAKSHIVVDVGGEYSRAKKRFDHHQKQKPANRPNGIPYAAFGLIWKTYGKKITSNKEVWEIVEKKLVMGIDALDNGLYIATPIYKGVHEYASAQLFSAIGMAYPEDKIDEAFSKTLEFAKLILQGEINKTEAKIQGEKIITAEIIKQGEPSVLVLDKYATWSVAVSKFKNIKLVVFPDKFSSKWCIQAASDKVDEFDGDRINFPKSWRGLLNADLALASGIIDSAFCHGSGHFAVVSSKNGAIEMANKVIATNP